MGRSLNKISGLTEKKSRSCVIDEFGSFLTAHHIVDFSEYNGLSRPILFLLAVGFPELDLPEAAMDSQALRLSEGMYGAYGKIVAVRPHGVTTSNPSPVFEVESGRPPGMSGGRVFNRAREVIGIVSGEAAASL